MNISKVSHLEEGEMIKNGSFFTPESIVLEVKEYVKEFIHLDTTIIDFGAGYGAFSKEFLDAGAKKVIATEVDHYSCEVLKRQFPKLDVVEENSLKNISKKKYLTDGNLIVIGNPPYNDVTSQYKKGEKGEEEMDESVVSRDLGIAFLKMFSEIEADVVCVLHPLSYLIKKNNFSSLKQFKDNYRLIKGTIFPSSMFESIKKNNIPFPVIIGLYKRDWRGMTYDYIKDFVFDIFQENLSFCLYDFKTIDGKVNKYPTKEKKPSDLQFYTIRDINALRRNKSFLTGFCQNGIKMNEQELYLYAWLDYFKNYFNPEQYYIFGNLSPLLPKTIELGPKFKNELEKYIVNTNDVVKKFVQENGWSCSSHIGKQVDFDFLNNCLLDSYQ